MKTEAYVVIEACLKAEKSGLSLDKTLATRLLNNYVKSRVAMGFSEKGVIAAIKAHVTRRLNGHQA